MVSYRLAASAVLLTLIATPALAQYRGYDRGGMSPAKRAQLERLLGEERREVLGPPPPRQADRGIQPAFLPVPRGCREHRVYVPGRPGVPGRTHVRVRCGN